MSNIKVQRSEYHRLLAVLGRFEVTGHNNSYVYLRVESDKTVDLDTADVWWDLGTPSGD